MRHRNGGYEREYMPDRRRRGVRFFTVLAAVWSFLCFTLTFFYNSPVNVYHPSPAMAAMIRENAKRYGLEEEQLQAVILTESRYDPKAVSETGARGVMQLMPDTAAWIAKESGLPATDLHKTEENIPLGAWYLDYLLKTYKGNKILALAAYNAGHGNVDAWRKEYGWADTFSDIDAIPFPETREFVRQVTENCEILRERKGK